MKLKLGGILGRAIGSIASQIIPTKLDGGSIGQAIGDLAPFKTGGAVGPRKKACLLHPHEFVLPANAKPTKKQRAIVAKNKRDAKKKDKK